MLKLYFLLSSQVQDASVAKMTRLVAKLQVAEQSVGQQQQVVNQLQSQLQVWYSCQQSPQPNNVL